MNSFNLTLEYLYGINDKFVKLICGNCGKEFIREKKFAINNLKRNRKIVCDLKCVSNLASKIRGDEFLPNEKVRCLTCSKIFEKKGFHIRKSPNHFCSRSCSATHRNKNKKFGTKRSKLEIFLEQKLTEKYNFEIHFNRKDAINSELDIYVPHINLAFELNGIFHYEPIFGEDKLIQIKNNDARKYQACLEKSIELCIIDTSSLKNFKPNKATEYLCIIEKFINSKINPSRNTIVNYQPNTHNYYSSQNCR